MIIVKNRELLIPEHERYIGTPIDNYADNRIFQIKRFSQSGEDLSGLTFRLDLKYPAERTVYTFTRSTTHTGGSVSVLSKTFVKAYPNAGTYTFSFNGTEWKRSSNAVDLEEIGVVINFTPVSGDTITIVSTTSNVSGNVVLLEKEIGENEINLIWHITENDTAIPGTVFVALRGSDGDATVRYASYYAALYVDANLDQTALPASGITELEQLENMTADQLRKMEYLYNRYKDLDVAAQDAEAWAKGTRNGYPVPAGDDTYQNNAKYYSDLREEATHLAEAWARGTRDGVDLPEGETGYHDNAKYWKIVSEGWTHGGTGTHTNEQADNSKYWSEISHAYANQVSYKKVYANVAEMVADTELIDGQVVRTLGYYAVNDGGGALYRIYSTAPVTHYETLQNGLYAELITDGTIAPEVMGAYGDGVHDDTQVFTSAVNTGMMVVCEKKYKITQKIQLKKGITGHGEIVFSGNGCFTVSMGTTVTGITVRTSGKLLDVMDTDIGSARLPNVHANVLFKNIDVVCESGASTLFDLKATTYGFFDMVFKDINVTGQCNKAVNIIATDPGWITQIMFIDCMFGRPLHVCTITHADRIHFERCTSQADDNNKNNLLYDVNDCKMFTIINCFDWDFSYKIDTKLYKFTDCRECVWIGNDRTISNFDNTIQELMHFFAVLMIGVSYAPAIYNKANVLNSVMDATDETFFQNPTGYGLTLVPVRTGQGVGFRAVNSYSLPYGAYSCDFVVNGQGQIKIRVRVPDPTNPDDQGRNRTKWSDYYTFTPDSELSRLFTISTSVISNVGNVKKVLFMATLSITGLTVSSANVNDVIANIPSGYRPAFEYNFIDTYSKKKFVISSNGDIIAKDTMSNSIIRGSFTYISV